MRRAVLVVLAALLATTAVPAEDGQAARLNEQATEAKQALELRIAQAKAKARETADKAKSEPAAGGEATAASGAAASGAVWPMGKRTSWVIARWKMWSRQMIFRPR
mgnify:CR=1 FL=1